MMAGRGQVASMREFVQQVAEEQRRARQSWAADWPRRYLLKVQRGLAEAKRIPPDVRIEVLSSGPCAYCGNPAPTQVDHVIPVSRGGGRRRRNLAPACWPCNYDKRDQTVAEWHSWRLSVGLPWPPGIRRTASRGELERPVPGWVVTVGT